MTNRTQMFNTAELPAALRNLVKLTGLRPKQTEIEFQSGPTTIRFGWRGEVVAGDSLLQSREVASWTGSDGEPNTITTEIYTGPVAFARKGHGKRNPSTVRVVLGNLGDLCPVYSGFKRPDPKPVSITELAVLWDASSSKRPEPVAEVVETEVCEPGPFNKLTERTETGRRVIEDRRAIAVSPSFTSHALASIEARHGGAVENAHMSAMAQLGID